MNIPGLPPSFHDTGRRRWQNWHENFEQQIVTLYDLWNPNPNVSSVGDYRVTTQGLQKIIQHAIDTDSSIRAVGGTWSFSRVAASDGILLNTRPLNYRFPISAQNTHPDYSGNASRVFVQCGTSIADLNVYLAARGLALRTSGASNGQTIAGALATGTHGAALHVGSVQEYVVAMHLINSAGKSLWLERDSYRVLADDVIKYFGAEKHRDDESFDAALVSFGSFGIVHGVILEVDPLYYLHGWRQRIVLDNAFWSAMTTIDFSGAALPGAADGPPGSGTRVPYHFQIVINPFEQSNEGMVTVMYKEDSKPPGSKDPPTGKILQGDNALEMVGLLTDIFGGTTSNLSKILSKLGYKPYKNVAGTPGQVFRDTTTRGNAASTAMGIPLDRAEEAVRIASERVRAARAPALVALRLVGPTKALLGFTQHTPATCVLEVDGPESDRLKRAYQEMWTAFEQAGIPYTFHWGKMNNLNATSVRRMYGNHVDRWSDVRRSILDTPELRRVFANDFTDRLDLSQ